VHIPDGFINAPVSLAAGAVTAAGIAVCLRRGREDLDDRLAPMAGLVAAFVFAVQMLNFPVAGGTSGHLLGGVLAATLVGPYVGALCLAVVLLVQALFADGGLTALGLNVLNMGLVGAIGGYLVVRALLAVMPKRHSSIPVAAGIGAGLSVVMAAAAFVGEFALGGTSGVPLGTVLAAMVGVHTLIGIGEGLITAATVATVLSVRPDLVHAARGLQRPLTLRTSAPAGSAA